MPEYDVLELEKLKTETDRYADRLGRRPTACVVTFGCQMNARDSEKLLGILLTAGFEESKDEKADLVVINTCTVRENANERLYGHLGHLNSMKREHPFKMIALCGCMMQEKDEVERIRRTYSFVDVVFGVHNLYRFPALLAQRMESGKRVFEVWDKAEKTVEDLPVKREVPYKSGVNISYGCDNFCTYCIVPYVRGRERSRKPEEILCEVKRLAEDGVIEIMQLGQNVNTYGNGLEEKVTFAELLEEVCKIPGIERVRFMTSHPKDLSDELIAVIARNPKVCRHLHLPLQSGSSRILKQMNRHYTKESYLDLARRIKEAVPGISLTTDIIVGFPGETEEDFEETLDVVRQVRFDSAFTFIYSPRTGTPAAKMEQVPPAVIKDRFARLLDLVQKIGAEESGRDVGKTMPALVEGIDPQVPGRVTGRLSNNVMVHFPGAESLIGTIVDVQLKEVHGFYYIGERVQL